MSLQIGTRVKVSAAGLRVFMNKWNGIEPRNRRGTILNMSSDRKFAYVFWDGISRAKRHFRPDIHVDLVEEL
jgi:hypothetical protein